MNQMSLHIVATDSVPRVADEAFAELGRIALDDGRTPELLRSAQVLIVRTRPIDGVILEQAPLLRVIARTGVGLDGIDLDEATRRRVPVIYTPDAGTLPIAEGTLALILATSKRLGELNAVVTEGPWQHRYQHDVRDLAGATLGVVGLGRIGTEVARLSHALGMRIIGYDPRPADQGDAASAFVNRVSLEELVSAADVITLHCGLNESSRGMIDRDLLARTKRGALLINASRGALVSDEDVLVEALDRGWLSGIGLDVFAHEPPDPASPLLHDRRVISTPHSIGLTRAWNERVFRSLAYDVRRWLDGEPPRFIANPELLANRTQNGGKTPLRRH